MTDEPKQSKGLDISLLGQPVLLDIPVVGKAQIDACTTDFLEWFRLGDRKALWADDRQFVRALLAERSAREVEGETPVHEQVALLDDNSIADIDQFLLTRLAPLWSHDFGSWSATDNDDQDSEPAATFLDHMRNYARDEVKANRALMEKALGTFPNPRLFAELDSVTRMLSENDTVSKAMRFADEHSRLLRNATAIEQLGGIGSISKEMEKALGGSIGSISKEIEKTLGGAIGSTGALKGGVLSEAMKASMGIGGSIKHLGGMETALDYARGLQDSHASRLAAIGSAFPRPLEGLSGIRDMLEGVSRADRLSSTVGEILAKQHQDLWGHHNRFESAVFSAKAFNLGLTASQIARLSGAIGGISPLDQLGPFRDLAKYLDPGFQSVAGLGISGTAGAGLVSDVLQAYDDQPSISGALFVAIVEGAHVIGNPAAPAREVRRAFHSVLTALDGLRRFATKEYEKVGLINMIGFIVALFSLWLALNPDDTAEKAMLKEAKEVRQQLDAIGDEIANDVRREASSQIRYVHAATPLRTSPGREGLVIRRIYPDQWLRVLEIKDDWAHVEVFDYQSDGSIDGWIYRTHLRRQGR